MRKGWEIKRLGDVCLKITDGSHNPPKGIEISEYLMLSSRDIYDEQIHYNNPRFLSKKDFENEDKRTAIKAKDVLLTIVGTIGRVAVVPNIYPKFTLQRSVAVLRPNINEIDPYFLKFLLQNSLNFLISESRGAAQKGIYLNQLKQIQISLPLLSEQLEIVSILDDAFESIERAKSNAEQNLKNAKELFQSYLQDVFENKGEEWETINLGEVVEVLDNLRKPITKKHRVEGLYPYYGATGILSYVHEYIFDERLILIGEDGAKWKSGDNTSFIAEGKYWVNNHAHVVRPIIEKVIDNWVVYFLNFSDLTSFISGMTVPKLNQGKMKSIPIPIPPLSEQKEIIRKFDVLSVEIKNLVSIYQDKLNDLEELKKSILQKAFNGELKTSKISA